MRVLLPVLFLFALPLTAEAGNVDLSLNDDAVNLAVGWNARDGRLALAASWLHNQDKGDAFGFLANVYGFATGSESPVRAGLGGMLAYTDPDNSNEDGFALAPGGFVSYEFPQYNRFTLYGHLYIAPSVLSFGDADQYLNVEARLIYKVIEDADIFLGVRTVHVDYDVGHTDFDTGMNVGINIRF